MAQMTESLARAILNGAGVTRNELEQLARCWISNHLSAQAKVRVTDEDVERALDTRLDNFHLASFLTTSRHEYAQKIIRAALESFAARLSQDSSWQAIVQHCMVTEAVTPREDDPYGTINDIISWHVNADRLSQGAQSSGNSGEVDGVSQGAQGEAATLAACDDGYFRRQFKSRTALVTEFKGHDLIERLKIAARALVRERKVYAEDVDTLLDVVRVLESLTADPQPPEGAGAVEISP